MKYTAPIADGKTTVNKKDAFNGDIISVLESNFSKGREQTKEFAKNFVGSDHEATAKNVWNYLRHKITYKRDSEARQQIRLPARLIADAATGADCKSFALFACSILANLGFKVAFRYTSYTGSSIPSHVYCVASKQGKKYIVDGVWNRFNSQKPYTHKIDHQMNVETLSGFKSMGNKRKVVNLNDKQTLQAIYDKIRNKQSLVARLIQKRLFPTGQTVNYSPAQLAAYKKRLTEGMMKHPDKAGYIYQLFADELTRVNSGTMTGAIFGVTEADVAGIAGRKKGKIKKFFKKVGKKAGQIIKKGSLAAPRTAFLGLVRLNVFGLASRLARGRATDPNKFKSFWKNLGGDVGTLSNVVTQGAKKKPILAKKINGIGGEPGTTVATAIALATPILIIAAKLFRKAPGEPDITTGDINDVAAALTAAGVDPGIVETVKDLGVQAYNSAGGGGIDTSQYPESAETESTGTGISFGGYMPWILGGGAALYFLSKSK